MTNLKQSLGRNSESRAIKNKINSVIEEINEQEAFDKELQQEFGYLTDEEVDAIDRQFDFNHNMKRCGVVALIVFISMGLSLYAVAEENRLLLVCTVLLFVLTLCYIVVEFFRSLYQICRE